MQKKWIFLILLILVISLSACNKNSNDESSDTKNQYLSKENMLSTEGLTKVEGDGFTYYTDIVGEAPNMLALGNSNINISYKNYNESKKNEEFNKLNKESLIKELENNGRIAENIEVKEKKIRGIKVKIVELEMDSENYMQFGGITKEGIVVITYLRYSKDDPLNKTFEHIINTIY